MRFHHFGVEVKNLEESIAFYKKLFQLELENHFSFMGEEIVFLASKDFRLELIANQDTMESAKSIHICFEVSNLLDVLDSADFIEKVEGPYELENGWNTAFFKGPHGEIIEFLQVR